MTRSTLTMLVAILGIAAAPGPVRPQELTEAQRARIDDVFGDLDHPGSPGAQVAVIRHGEIAYSKGFGHAQLEYDIPVTPSTVFHVASVSKQFTAMSVLLLEADGGLSIDADVREYLPEVPDMGAVVTPRHLLQHTSGVRDQWELVQMAGWRMDDVISGDDIRRMLVHQRELNFPPGSEYLYSNMGYSIAADLVARVSGMDFQDFARARIFEPLGMTRTHVHDDHQHLVPNRAYSYRPDGDGYRKAVLSYANRGATSLFTTAEDLVRWLDNFRTHVVGDEELVRTMHTPAVLSGGDTIVYALGVQSAPYRGFATVGHGGADAGFRSFVIWYPELETGIAVLTNVSNGNPAPRSRAVGHIVLEAELGALEADEDEDRPEAVGEVETVEVDRETLESYAGPFATPLGVVRFELRGPDLWLTAPQTIRLLPVSERSFVSADGEGRAVFHSADSVTISNDDGVVLEGSRFVPAGAAELDAYVGTYYSPEIETIYEVRRLRRRLVLHHVRLGDVPLTALGVDRFGGGRSFLRELAFTRGHEGGIDGFRLTGNRVRNLRFVKLPGGLPR